jgi:hypothetical protein
LQHALGDRPGHLRDRILLPIQRDRKGGDCQGGREVLPLQLITSFQGNCTVPHRVRAFRYAPTLSRHVTHLVVASTLEKGSEKLATARKKTASGSWSVSIVQLQWLQQCVSSRRLHAAEPYQVPGESNQEATPVELEKSMPESSTAEHPCESTPAAQQQVPRDPETPSARSNAPTASMNTHSASTVAAPGDTGRGAAPTSVRFFLLCLGISQHNTAFHA